MMKLRRLFIIPGFGGGGTATPSPPPPPRPVTPVGRPFSQANQITPQQGGGSTLFSPVSGTQSAVGLLGGTGPGGGGTRGGSFSGGRSSGGGGGFSGDI